MLYFAPPIAPNPQFPLRLHVLGARCLVLAGRQKAGSGMRRCSCAIFAGLVSSVCGVAFASDLTSERVDARAIWVVPHSVNPDKCEGNDSDLRHQVACVARLMNQSGASRQAVDFTRRLAAQTKNIGYLSKLRSFGPLALGTVEWPFMQNTNAHSDSGDYILNGNPEFISGTAGCADNDPSFLSSPAFQRLKHRHPNISTWEGTSFVSESALADGGASFVFSCPLGEFHAEAGRWNALIALDFDASGKFLGHKLIRISGE